MTFLTVQVWLKNIYREAIWERKECSFSRSSWGCGIHAWHAIWNQCEKIHLIVHKGHGSSSACI